MAFGNAAVPAAVAMAGLVAAPTGLDEVASLIVGAGAAGRAVLSGTVGAEAPPACGGVVAAGAAGFGGVVAVGGAGCGGVGGFAAPPAEAATGGTDDVDGPVRGGGIGVGGRLSSSTGVGVAGVIEGPLVVADPGAGMPAPGVGGLTGCTAVVADGLAGGASDAFKVTRTVSFFSGMLVVCFEDSCLGEEPASFFGGSTVPVCWDVGALETGGAATGGFTTGEVAPGGLEACFINGMLAVCFDGAAPACFSKGTLAVCLEGAALAACFKSGTLAVCFDGALETCLSSGTLVVCFDGAGLAACLSSGTLVVCFDGGAAEGFGGEGGCFS